jgi:hypothetical protein
MPKVRSSRKPSVSGPAFRWPLTIPHVPASVEAYARCRLIPARLFRVAADLHDDELARAWVAPPSESPTRAQSSRPSAVIPARDGCLRAPAAGGPRGQPQEHRSHAIADGVDVRRDPERGPPAGVDPACAVHALGPVARFAPTRSDPRHPSPVQRRCASTPQSRATPRWLSLTRSSWPVWWRSGRRAPAVSTEGFLCPFDGRGLFGDPGGWVGTSAQRERPAGRLSRRREPACGVRRESGSSS